MKIILKVIFLLLNLGLTVAFAQEGQEGNVTPPAVQVASAVNGSNPGGEAQDDGVLPPVLSVEEADRLLNESQQLVQNAFISGLRFDSTSAQYFRDLCEHMEKMVDEVLKSSGTPGDRHMALLYGIANLASSLVGTFGQNSESPWFKRYTYEIGSQRDAGRSIWRDLAYLLEIFDSITGVKWGKRLSCRIGDFVGAYDSFCKELGFKIINGIFTNDFKIIKTALEELKDGNGGGPYEDIAVPHLWVLVNYQRDLDLIERIRNLCKDTAFSMRTSSVEDESYLQRQLNLLEGAKTGKVRFNFERLLKVMKLLENKMEGGNDKFKKDLRRKVISGGRLALADDDVEENVDYLIKVLKQIVEVETSQKIKVIKQIQKTLTPILQVLFKLALSLISVDELSEEDSQVATETLDYLLAIGRTEVATFSNLYAITQIGEAFHDKGISGGLVAEVKEELINEIKSSLEEFYGKSFWLECYLCRDETDAWKCIRQYTCEGKISKNMSEEATRELLDSLVRLARKMQGFFWERAESKIKPELLSVIEAVVRDGKDQRRIYEQMAKVRVWSKGGEKKEGEWDTLFRDLDDFARSYYVDEDFVASARALSKTYYALCILYALQYDDITLRRNHLDHPNEYNLFEEYYLAGYREVVLPVGELPLWESKIKLLKANGVLAEKLRSKANVGFYEGEVAKLKRRDEEEKRKQNEVKAKRDEIKSIMCFIIESFSLPVGKDKIDDKTDGKGFIKLLNDCWFEKREELTRVLSDRLKSKEQKIDSCDKEDVGKLCQVGGKKTDITLEGLEKLLNKYCDKFVTLFSDMVEGARKYDERYPGAKLELQVRSWNAKYPFAMSKFPDLKGKLEELNRLVAVETPGDQKANVPKPSSSNKEIIEPFLTVIGQLFDLRSNFSVECEDTNELTRVEMALDYLLSSFYVAACKFKTDKTRHMITEWSLLRNYVAHGKDAWKLYETVAGNLDVCLESGRLAFALAAVGTDENNSYYKKWFQFVHPQLFGFNVIGFGKVVKDHEIDAQDDFGPEYEVVPIEGDGNCFFRAVEKAQRDNDKEYAELRKKAIAQLQAQPERYLVGIPEAERSGYISQMEGDGAWVDGRVIYALADALSLRITIHTNRPGDRPFIIEPVLVDPQQPVQEIDLGYYVGLHYVALRGVGNGVGPEAGAEAQVGPVAGSVGLSTVPTESLVNESLSTAAGFGESAVAPSSALLDSASISG